MRFSKYIIIFLIFLFVNQVFARPPKNYNPKLRLNKYGRLYKSAELDTTEGPHQFNLTWVGVGNLARYTVTNVGESGYFSAPTTWDGTYDGSLYPGWYSGNPVHTGEFPAGSKQFYVWAAGLWVGAEVPVQTQSGTIYDQRVAACAYYSDQGSLFPLYLSTQLKSDGSGEYLFKQPGTEGNNQEIWPFTDTTLNARRRELEQEKGLSGLTLQKGDFVSNQDSYTIFGDYIPEKDAITVFSFGYDEDPVGIKVIQRTYSWGYSYNDKYIYFDFLIINMNDFPLKNVYFGYFMDTDIGDSDSPDGAWDDLIGFDEGLALGYCYDSDLQEPNWQTQAGYIGVTFVETPKRADGTQLGLTGFQTWENGGEEGQRVEGEKHDKGKYEQLSKGGYEFFETPQDVRMLPCSGPVLEMAPGDTVHLVVAVVVGNSLAELKENTQRAIEQYNNAYVGPTAPPIPRFSVVPADSKVYLRWDNFPETIADPMTGKFDFEGYRIYRSTSGISGTWEKIADFDVPGDKTGRVAVAKYSKGNSLCTITIDSIDQETNFYKPGEYKIEFLTDTTFMVYNYTNGYSYHYNKKAQEQGSGFCVIDPATKKIQEDNKYVSGYWIYFDGVYAVIKNGEKKIKPTDFLEPKKNDVFTITTYADKEIGNQTGLQYAYIDSGLINGMTYYYAMTSYDKGDLEFGIDPLESGIEMNKVSVIPTSLGVDVTDASVSEIEHVNGISQGTITVSLLDATQVTGHQYKISFGKSDAQSPYNLADFWKLIDLTDNKVVVDSNTNMSGQRNPLYDGLVIRVINKGLSYDSIYWVGGSNTTMDFNVISSDPEPYDYEIRFTESGSMADNNVQAPFEVWNTILDSTEHFIYVDKPPKGEFTDGELIYIKNRYKDKGYTVQIKIAVEEGDVAPEVGDIFRITTTKPFQTDDEYVFSTTALKGQKDKYSLDNIKVVPNPYYIRASWDLNRFEQKVYFQNLPSKCTIRIFNTAGVLIKTINHESAEKNGSCAWDLRTEENLDIVNGLYIYQVEDSKGNKKVGKFAVIR